MSGEIVNIPKEELIQKLKQAVSIFDEIHTLSNKDLRKYYNEDAEQLYKNSNLKYLYPSLYDPLFNYKIYEKKEFNDLKFDTYSKDVESEAEKMCNAEFELSPHQIFVRNFLSFLTPYNSLLLYHGLGTGKTCSSISVCEEMREYMNQMGIKKKIIIVASPNVQENFKTQLFDERKLVEVDGLWTMKGCTGNKFLKEINPMNMKGLSRDKIISQVKKLIRENYAFMGYIGFSNYITRIKNRLSEDGSEVSKSIRIKAIQKEFSNRLIVIDEVHNLRVTDDNPNKDIGKNLLDLVKYSDTLKLLLLSATPMFNSYKEIIWLLNLMNLNDGRPPVELNEIFDSKGNLLVKDGREIGKETLAQMMNGYISFVRGENPYTFPFRIFPSEFAIENSVKNPEFIYPRKQVNGKTIVQGITHVDVFLNDIGEYQRKGYEYTIRDLTSSTSAPGWNEVKTALQALNFVYPGVRLDKTIEGEDVGLDVNEFVGKSGLDSTMIYDTTKKNDFEYSERTLERYGRIFSQEEIGRYSKKMENLLNAIKKSKGTIIVYSQYIDGGCVPIALALEQIGVTRYKNKNLFKNEPTSKVDATTMKPKGKHGEHTFKPARYIMITGDKKLSPNNKVEIKAATNESNKYGEDVKVIIISRAGSEGIDFNNIRQIHIMDPWYNMSRIEQTIGRGVRYRSHCMLPFKERNTEIYLYGSRSYDEESTEPIDLYIYRNAEVKALQIGKVSRIMKEHAVDCYLNRALNEMTTEDFNKTVQISLSSRKDIAYQIGDKPYTQVCDYMESCVYKCLPEVDRVIKDEDVILDTYNENFITLNIEKVTQRIKDVYKTNFIMKKVELINSINKLRTYPLIQINSALNHLVNDRSEFLTDLFGNIGHLINIGDYYLFQPLEVSEKHISHYDRMKPIDFKPKGITVNVVETKKRDIPTITRPRTSSEKEDTQTTYESLINTINKQIEKSYSTTQHTKRGETDWYIHFSSIKDRLSRMIGEDSVYILLVHHIIDELRFNDKKILIENIFNVKEQSDLEKTIQKYIEDVVIIKSDELEGILLYDVKRGIQIPSLFVLENKNGKTVLRPSKPVENREFMTALESKNYAKNQKSKIHSLFGFISYEKNDFIFKTKDYTGKNLSKGAICRNAGKAVIKNLLNSITNSNEFTSENIKKLKPVELCAVTEFILRHYNNIEKEDKIWFFNYENALLNNVKELKA